MSLDSVFAKLGIICGFNEWKDFNRRDRMRVHKLEYNSTAKQIKVRKSKIRQRLEEESKNKDIKGVSHENRGF